MEHSLPIFTVFLSNIRSYWNFRFTSIKYIGPFCICWFIELLRIKTIIVLVVISILMTIIILTIIVIFFDYKYSTRRKLAIIFILMIHFIQIAALLKRFKRILRHLYPRKHSWRLSILLFGTIRPWIRVRLIAIDSSFCHSSAGFWWSVFLIGNYSVVNMDLGIELLLHSILFGYLELLAFGLNLLDLRYQELTQYSWLKSILLVEYINEIGFCCCIK